MFLLNTLPKGHETNTHLTMYIRVCLHKRQADAPKNPRAVAEAILASLPSTEYVPEAPTLAGPGFINVKIGNEWMATRIQTMLKDGIKSWAPRLNRQRVVIDFSSPNVAKEMHVGHLRSTIIGDTISKMLEYCGADVLKLNHVVSMCELPNTCAFKPSLQCFLLCDTAGISRQPMLTSSGGCVSLVPPCSQICIQLHLKHQICLFIHQACSVQCIVRIQSCSHHRPLLLIRCVECS